MRTKEEKDGERRVAGRERIILCLLYFNSEKQTQYYDICGFGVVAAAAGVLLFFVRGTAMPLRSFFVFFSSLCFSRVLLVLYFCCFSFAHWIIYTHTCIRIRYTFAQYKWRQQRTIATGWMYQLFLLIPCVHYHIFPIQFLVNIRCV